MAMIMIECIGRGNDGNYCGLDTFLNDGIFNGS